MSILFRGSRPIVAFDVENPDHRRWYAEFVKYNTWGRCPVRFMAEALDQDLVSFVNGKMLTYYIRQEFENAKNKVKVRKSAPKPKSAQGSVQKRQPLQAKGRKTQTPVSTQA
jgi:hypothetical protein